MEKIIVGALIAVVGGGLITHFAQQLKAIKDNKEHVCSGNCAGCQCQTQNN